MTTCIKSILIYLGGVITGVVLTMAILAYYVNRPPNDGLVMTDSSQQEIEANYFKVSSTNYNYLKIWSTNVI
jgi:hypothetical protein